MLIFGLSIFIVKETNLNITKNNQNIRLFFYVIIFLPTYYLWVIKFQNLLIYFNFLFFFLAIFLVLLGVMNKTPKNLSVSQFSLFKNNSLYPIFLREVSTVYFLFGVSTFLVLYKSLEDLNWVIFTFISVMSVDIFAYLIGSIIGKRKIKILSKISPNKTFEGFAAGLILGGLFIFSIQYVISLPISTQWLIFLSIVIPLLAITGDLLASGIKRYFDIKNFSEILPGHGGILDRLDSLVPVLIFLSFVKVIIL
tara:strand:- start:172 stop:930 length:759 start_codon:yes stop_codon:yes gene_type:complete